MTIDTTFSLKQEVWQLKNGNVISRKVEAIAVKIVVNARQYQHEDIADQTVGTPVVIYSFRTYNPQGQFANWEEVPQSQLFASLQDLEASLS
jgi:hypothetical protein